MLSVRLFTEVTEKLPMERFTGGDKVSSHWKVKGWSADLIS
jgi:hypothetical protein